MINKRATLSVRAADRFSTIVGSWRFILMNLMLSLQAAFAAQDRALAELRELLLEKR